VNAGIPPSPELHEVRLLRLPVALHAGSQEHGAELMREMYLVAQQVHESGPSDLPARLIALVDELGNRFNGMTTVQEQQIEAAIAAELDEIVVVYRIPREAAGASQHLGDVLDEADEFCRQGKHLLTLATPEEMVRYRRWFLGEFVSQLAGAAPTSWPEYVARSDSLRS
jgi:hypothetical protein